jgi:hypothetical protein
MNWRDNIIAVILIIVAIILSIPIASSLRQVGVPTIG